MSDQPDLDQLLRCPACKSQLVGGHCQACDHTFSKVLGIWDLRWPRPDQSESLDEHTLIEERILARFIPDYDRISFTELVGMAMEATRETLDTSEALIQMFSNYKNQPIARGNPMMEMFAETVASHYSLPGASLAVDIGCGVGTASLSLASDFAQIIGIDPFLSNLLMAQKYCKENNIDNVNFLQARAQHLPLAERCADYIVAQNVVEHLIEVEPAFLEVARVLTHGGCFCADSRNRYDLFFPEPHVKLRFLGYLPRSIQPWMARRLRRLPYIGVRLLSLKELQRYARRAFGGSMEVTLPRVSAYGASDRWDQKLALVKDKPLLKTALLFIFPTHILVARVD